MNIDMNFEYTDEFQEKAVEKLRECADELESGEAYIKGYNINVLHDEIYGLEVVYRDTEYGSERTIIIE